MTKKDKIPAQNLISRDPYPRSRKIYVKGKMYDIKVAMREIGLDDSDPEFSINGNSNKNHPIAVYDTSGPYTDHNVEIDVSKGLPRLREKWILDRGDVERLTDFSSDRKSTRLNSSHIQKSRMPSSA